MCFLLLHAPAGRGVLSSLTAQERETIGLLLAADESLSDIARALGRDRSTISRERLRHVNRDGTYRPLTAQKRGEQTARTAHARTKKLSQSGPLRDYVVHGLKQRWSPQEIASLAASTGQATRPCELGVDRGRNPPRPDATICLASALAHNDLTDEIPEALAIAIPRGSRVPASEGAIAWHLFDPPRSTSAAPRSTYRVRAHDRHLHPRALHRRHVPATQ